MTPASATESRTAAPRRRWLGWALAVALVLLLAASTAVGSAGSYGADATLRGLLALVGLAEPLEGAAQVILAARVDRALLTVGVGAGLALSGGLLQGVFRNDLASPGLLGVTSGAGLGAALAILALGGYGPLFALSAAGIGPLALVTAAALVGALAVVVVVTVLGTSGGRVSIPTLLLVGIAVNAIAGGIVAAIQSFALADFEVARALFAWGFGSLDDRSSEQVALVLAATALSALVIPFVARELDLFDAGEDDARALGVDTTRVKWVALAAASLSAAAAVSVAGQIAFVGLMVPHLVRLVAGRAHGRLLPLCLLAGPVVLLGADLAQRALLAGSAVRPGVLMSLVGGPFFLFLLMRDRRRLTAW